MGISSSQVVAPDHSPTRSDQKLHPEVNGVTALFSPLPPRQQQIPQADESLAALTPPATNDKVNSVPSRGARLSAIFHETLREDYHQRPEREKSGSDTQEEGPTDFHDASSYQSEDEWASHSEIRGRTRKLVKTVYSVESYGDPLRSSPPRVADQRLLASQFDDASGDSSSCDSTLISASESEGDIMAASKEKPTRAEREARKLHRAEKRARKESRRLTRVSNALGESSPAPNGAGSEYEDQDEVDDSLAAGLNGSLLAQTPTQLDDSFAGLDAPGTQLLTEARTAARRQPTFSSQLDPLSQADQSPSVQAKKIQGSRKRARELEEENATATAEDAAQGSPKKRARPAQDEESTQPKGKKGKKAKKAIKEPSVEEPPSPKLASPWQSPPQTNGVQEEDGSAAVLQEETARSPEKLAQSIIDEAPSLSRAKKAKKSNKTQKAQPAKKVVPSKAQPEILPPDSDAEESPGVVDEQPQTSLEEQTRSANSEALPVPQTNGVKKAKKSKNKQSSEESSQQNAPLPRTASATPAPLASSLFTAVNGAPVETQEPAQPDVGEVEHDEDGKTTAQKEIKQKKKQKNKVSKPEQEPQANPEPHRRSPEKAVSSSNSDEAPASGPSNGHNHAVPTPTQDHEPMSFQAWQKTKAAEAKLAQASSQKTKTSGTRKSSKRAEKRSEKQSKSSKTESSTGTVVGPFTDAEIEIAEAQVEQYRVLQKLSAVAIGKIFEDKSSAQDHHRRAIYNLVSEDLPQRSRKSVRQFVARRFCGAHRGKWEPEEDELLREAYEEKPGAWTVIAAQLERMPEDCRDRWRDITGLKDRQAGKWDDDEVKALEKAVETIVGRMQAEGDASLVVDQSGFADRLNWSRVSEVMGGKRSRLQCRHKWLKIGKKRLREASGKKPRKGKTSKTPKTNGEASASTPSKTGELSSAAKAYEKKRARRSSSKAYKSDEMVGADEDEDDNQTAQDSEMQMYEVPVEPETVSGSDSHRLTIASSASRPVVTGGAEVHASRSSISSDHDELLQNGDARSFGSAPPAQSGSVAVTNNLVSPSGLSGSVAAHARSRKAVDNFNWPSTELTGRVVELDLTNDVQDEEDEQGRHYEDDQALEPDMMDDLYNEEDDEELLSDDDEAVETASITAYFKDDEPEDEPRDSQVDAIEDIDMRDADGEGTPPSAQRPRTRLSSPDDSPEPTPAHRDRQLAHDLRVYSPSPSRNSASSPSPSPAQDPLSPTTSSSIVPSSSPARSPIITTTKPAPTPVRTAAAAASPELGSPSLLWHDDPRFTSSARRRGEATYSRRQRRVNGAVATPHLDEGAGDDDEQHSPTRGGGAGGRAEEPIVLESGEESEEEEDEEEEEDDEDEEGSEDGGRL